MSRAHDDALDAADDALVAAVDAALAAAEHAAGARLDYRRGCPACCLGPFPITPLDARRLRRGLAALTASDPGRGAAIRARARADVAALAPHFPGDAATGRLSDDERAEEAIAARFSARPCPALDPASGRCDLYAFRPLSCRTYGPPVRLGGEALPPCERCFPACGDDEAERCRAAIDPEGREAALLCALAARGGDDGETLVAFALGLPEGERQPG
jgi:Fe-S-cluster containining protein